MHGLLVGSFQRERWVGCGLGQSLAQLTSLVQTQLGGGRKEVVGRNPGAGSILQAGTERHSPEMGGVAGRRGGREGSHPFPQ